MKLPLVYVQKHAPERDIFLAILQRKIAPYNKFDAKKQKYRISYSDSMISYSESMFYVTNEKWRHNVQKSHFNLP